MKSNFIKFYTILFLTLGFSSFVFADSARDIDVDRAIAGMDEGSRMLASDSPEMPGTALSPAADTKVIISPAAQKDIVGLQAEASGGNFSDGAISGPQETAGGTTDGVDTGTDVGGPSQEPITETPNLIIDVDAGIDTDSGIIDADVGVNPEGDQLLDADVAGSEVDADLTETGLEGESQIDIGGAVDIPVEDDIGDPEEPADETSSIIDIDASADLDSGTVDANLDVNPDGDQLLDADVGGTGAGTTESIEADIGTTGDLIEPDSAVVAEPVTVAPPAGLSAEVDTTGETVGDETEIGVEADVSGASAGEEIVDDPTDDGIGGL